MNANWLEKPLGEVCELTNGRAFKSSEWESTGSPIIRIQNLNNPALPFNYYSGSLPQKFRVKSGDILLSWSGTPGTSFGCFEWKGPEGWLNQHIYRVKLPPSILPRFFVHQINSKLSEMISLAHGGVGLQHVTKPILNNLVLFLPPLTEQKRIVNLLDEAEALRRLRAEADFRIADLIPAIFHEMFGGPTKNLKHWPLKKVGDLLISCEYGTSKKADEDGQGVPVLRMNNATYSGELDLHDLKYVVLSDKELNKQRLVTGDVLFNRTNSRDLVGKTCCWDGRFEAVAASYFIRLRFDPDRENYEHFTAFMNLPLMKGRLEQMARGAVGQANINAQELRSISLPVPPISMQRQFAARVADIRTLQAQQAASRQRLDDLFQSMLYRAFRGEL